MPSNNEPRSVATLANFKSPPEAYGTFQGSGQEFARYCFEQFESDVNLKGLLRKLVSMMASWVGLESVEYRPFTAIDHAPGLDDSLISFPGYKILDKQLVRETAETLRSYMSRSKFEAWGVNRLSINGFELYYACFAGHRGAEGFLVWTTQDFAGKCRNSMSEFVASPGRQQLDLLVESAQQAAKWLMRLDHAQALLYEDDVTGLFNFRYLDVALDSEFRRLQRFRSPFSVLFIDIDNFKQVNDIYGHLVGSSVLRQVGAQIRSALRDVDVVIRYGGDEFVVVLIGTNSNQALQAAERVRSQVDRFGFVAEGYSDSIRVTASIGVASCPQHARDKQSLLKLADETMYAAKRSGKNRVIMVQDKPDQAVFALTTPRRIQG